MGFESFRVELRGPTPTPRVREAVLAVPHAEAGAEDVNLLPGSDFFSVRDGKHVFELELSRTSRQSSNLSIRFTLAHPQSVDAAFLQLVERLVATSGLRAFVLDDDVTTAFPDGFGVGDFDRFAEFVCDAIEVERWRWVTQFGSKPLAGSTREVFEQIILPRCEPLNLLSPDEVLG